MLNVIRSLCKERGITVKDLENALGFGNGTIGHWKTSKPKYDKLLLVANYFGCTVEELVADNPPIPAALEVDGLSDTKRKLIEKIVAGTDEDAQDVLAMWDIVQRNKNAPPEGRGGE